MNGWNRPKESDRISKSQPSKNDWVKWIIVAILLLLVGCAGYTAWRWYASWSKESSRTVSQQSKAPETVTPKPSKTINQTLSAGNSFRQKGTNEPPVLKLPKPPSYLPPDAVFTSVSTNADKIIEVWTDSRGLTHRVRKNARKPIFTNRSDQMLATFFAASESPGAMMPPLPSMSRESMDQAFADSLKQPIIINDDDTDRVKALKEFVLQARQEMFELIGQGMSVSEALETCHREANENAKLRNAAKNELVDLVRSGDANLAKQYMEESNKVFKDMGVVPLEWPSDDELSDDE